MAAVALIQMRWTPVIKHSEQTEVQQEGDRPLQEPVFPVERPGPAVMGVVLASVLGVAVFIGVLLLGMGLWAALGYAIAAQVLVLGTVIGTALALTESGPSLTPGPRTRPSPPDASEPQGLADSILARWDVITDTGTAAPCAAHHRIALAAPRSPVAGSLARRLSEDGCEVHVSDGIEEMLEAVATNPDEWSALIVDLDDGRDIGEAIDSLVLFREQAPQVPVVALSASVACDDLGTERLALCDATLRKPVMRLSLMRGLDAAQRNNLLWQSRLSDIARQ